MMGLGAQWARGDRVRERRRSEISVCFGYALQRTWIVCFSRRSLRLIDSRLLDHTMLSKVKVGPIGARVGLRQVIRNHRHAQDQWQSSRSEPSPWVSACEIPKLSSAQKVNTPAKDATASRLAASYSDPIKETGQPAKRTLIDVVTHFLLPETQSLRYRKMTRLTNESYIFEQRFWVFTCRLLVYPNFHTPSQE